MADYANNIGSRVHFILEEKGMSCLDWKEIREPEFNCDFEQTIISDNMVESGVDFYKRC
jgi:hypothetical protein